MTSQEQWNKVSFVEASDYRTDILNELTNGPATPTDISEAIDAHISPTSRALGELRDEELIQLLVSEDKQKGRLYGITEEGMEILELVESL